MQLFYQPDTPDSLWLPEEESRHCAKVLRHRIGDVIWVTNGKNQLFEAKLTAVTPARCSFTIINEVQQPARPYHIHLAIAPTKNSDRLEWMLEKCVELGLDELSLLQCKHSERIKINTDRLLKKAISAMKQSLHLQLPLLHEPCQFEEFIAQQSKNAQARFIAYVDDTPRPHLYNAAAKENTYCILIGPEGDFSAAEIEAAFSAGFKPVSLGPSRLRTETAGLAAAHILNLLNQV